MGDTQIVTTILALAKGLELQAIAEGNETHQQYEFLREQGCQFGQGFLMSLALPADSLAAMLSQQTVLLPAASAPTADNTDG